MCADTFDLDDFSRLLDGLESLDPDELQKLTELFDSNPEAVSQRLKALRKSTRPSKAKGNGKSRKDCEVCGEPAENLYGCEKCGRMFGDCCNSVMDAICVDCV